MEQSFFGDIFNKSKGELLECSHTRFLLYVDKKFSKTDHEKAYSRE